jgi:hypothetical protein
LGYAPVINSPLISFAPFASFAVKDLNSYVVKDFSPCYQFWQFWQSWQVLAIPHGQHWPKKQHLNNQSGHFPTNIEPSGGTMTRKLAWLALALAIPAFSVHHPQSERITRGPVVEGVGDTWAVIAWTTNTGGSTVVHYGTDPNHLNRAALAPYSDNETMAAQNHRVHLKNLKPATTYYFMADSAQGEGTGTEVRSSVGQFTTRGAGQGSASDQAARRPLALKITDGPRVEGVGPTWAVIAWTTNTGGSSVVRYGTDPRNLNETAQAPYSDDERMSAQNHRVRINNLKPGATYHFMVDSGQGEDTGTEAKSSVGQFTPKSH